MACGSFRSNIHLKIDNCSKSTFEKTNSIKTSYLVEKSNGTMINVKNLPHVRLGIAETEFGQLDLHFAIIEPDNYTIAEVKSIVYFEIKKSMREFNITTSSCFFSEMKNFEKKTDNELSIEEITCNLSHHDFFKIIEYLFINKFMTNLPIMFFETFGNKRSTICNSLDFKNIKDKISSTFNEIGHSFLNVDVCISTSFGSGTVTFANENFFKETKLHPNYTPLFTNTVLNCHQNTIDSKTGKTKTAGVFDQVSKINFYSTFTYYFNFDSFPNYVFPLTNSLMLNKFFGHRIFSNPGKFEKLKNKYLEIRSKIDQDITAGTGLYRTEIRTNLIKAPKLLEILKTYIKPHNFNYYDSKQFFDVIHANITRFIKIIEAPDGIDSITTPESLVKSLIAEYILKTLYITGSTTNSVFTKTSKQIIYDNIKLSSNSIAVLNNIYEAVNAVYESLDYPQKLELLTKQINYSFPLGDLKKPLLIDLIDTAFNFRNSNINMLEKMVLSYIREKTGYDVQNFDLLKLPISNNNKVGVAVALKKIFIHSNFKIESSVTKIFYTLYKMKHSIESDTEALSNLINFFKNNDIRTVYKSKVFNKLDKINLSYSKLKTNKPKIISDREQTFKTYIALCTIKASSSKTIDHHEMIRYLHALYHYTDSGKRITSVMYDFAYGITPVRNMFWVKNKLHQLSTFMLNNQADFINIITQIKEWSPDKFNWIDRQRFFMLHGITLDENLSNLYLKLMTYDIDAWWESPVKLKLSQDTPYDIFYKIVKSASIYLSIATKITEWSSIPVLAIIPVRTTEIFEIQETPLTQEIAKIDEQIGMEEVDEIEEIGMSNDDEIENQYSEHLDFFDNYLDLDPISLNEEFQNYTFINTLPDDLREAILLNETKTVFKRPIVDIPWSQKRLKSDVDKKIIFDSLYQSYIFQISKLGSLLETMPFTNVQDNFDSYVSPIDTELDTFVPPIDNDFFEFDTFTPQIETVISAPSLYKEKLFSKYRYRTFNLKKARKDMFSFDYRPSVTEWNNLINSMVKDNELSILPSSDSSMNYKFNIKIEKASGYLNHQYMLKTISRSLSKNSLARVSASKLRDNVRSSMRPSMIEWERYLQDLVNDGFLVLLEEDRVVYYKLRSY